jgi:predicted N-acetyltransferase YhbS/ketosteroid isomerase-like protein
MSDPRQLAYDFLSALAANDPTQYERVLHEDVGMRLGRWDGGEAYRPRDRVMRRLMEEWAAWPDPTLEAHTVLADGERVAVEFRIQATENQRYVEHNRAAFLTIKDGQVQAIDLYCPEPVPSARRKGWIAPATIAGDELRRLFDSLQYTFDIREWIPPSTSGMLNLRCFRGGSGDVHPGSNIVFGARWTPEEADARIEQLLAYHREREIGFQWLVGPFDTPADLRERLERHGLVLAGDQAMMARVGLEDLDIPTNPHVTVEVLDGSDNEALEAVLQILARCFNWTPQQVDERRPAFIENLKDPKLREKQIQYLARLDGTPVADARVFLQGSMAYLGGASTLPEYRNQKIYSTLLRRRLEDARERGYQIVVIHAEPMSRRVVSRYGFEEFARFHIYAWMPVIDMEVIRGLVPDE